MNQPKKDGMSRRVYDNSFKMLFSDKESCIRLYNENNEEGDKATEADFGTILETEVFYDAPVNDLAFLVKDRCIVLVEAQSTWNINIVGRCLLYFCHALVSYFNNHSEARNNLLHKKDPVDFPRVEVMVVNTSGVETPEVLSFRETYFPGTPCDCDLRIRVIDGTRGTGLLKEYIEFCDVYRKNYRLCGGNRAEAADKTMEECRNLGIMVKLREMGGTGKYGNVRGNLHRGRRPGSKTTGNRGCKSGRESNANQHAS